ncbi:hypothetical protein [Anaeromyxobacter oryzae]|uniref:hypothetical protein n=1 Tax=Anaeromyxobacter oryzae TaxID=2918170 RepID=UPI0020BF7D56|nr:hypothetical protein [Anaeromyxobacter oryzae]
MPPALGAAIGLGVRALLREGWLVAAGLAVGILRRLLAVPALAFAWGLLLEAAVLAARSRPLDLLAPVEGVLAAATSQRFLAIAAGLWLAGVLAGAALRLAFLAGAAPVLASAMARAPVGADGFAAGVAWGFPRVLGTALLGLAAELGGGGFAVVLALGAARITAASGHASPLLAAPVALALTLAVAVPIALSAAVDGAVARAAVTGEGPLVAFAAATRRFVNRPGAFVLGAITFAVVAGLATASVEATGNALTALADGASPLLLAGPGLLIAALATAVGAAVDLAWLGTVSALACAEG